MKAKPPTVFGILPIKEHSDRVPGKNFRIVEGAALWMYALGNLARSCICDKIIINTDLPGAFANVTTLCPIDVDERPEHLRATDVSMNDILADVISRHRADIYIQIHATSPFVYPWRFQKALRVLEKSGAECAYAVTEHHARFDLENGRPINHDPGALIPTQDLAPLYEENSAFYFFRYESFMRTGSRVGGRRTRIVTHPIEAIDIDEPCDMELAELVIAGRKAQAAKNA